MHQSALNSGSGGFFINPSDPITVSALPFTAPKDCYFSISATANGGKIKINNVEVTGSMGGAQGNFYCFLKKGQTVSCTAAVGAATLKAFGLQ